MSVAKRNLKEVGGNLLNKHVEKKETAKFNAKMDRAMEKGIVFGVPNQSFAAVVYSIPISQVLAHPKGPDTIKRTITDKILPKLKDGNIVLNTNIPESILKEAGLKEGQYVKPQSNSIEIGKVEEEQNVAKGRCRR